MLWITFHTFSYFFNRDHGISSDLSSVRVRVADLLKRSNMPQNHIDSLGVGLENCADPKMLYTLDFFQKVMKENCFEAIPVNAICRSIIMSFVVKNKISRDLNRVFKIECHNTTSMGLNLYTILTGCQVSKSINHLLVWHIEHANKTQTHEICEEVVNQSSVVTQHINNEKKMIEVAINKFAFFVQTYLQRSTNQKKHDNLKNSI